MKSKNGAFEIPPLARFSFALPLALSLALMLGGTARAEEAEIISLTRDEVTRMKLVFEPAKTADLRYGNTVPATVINSPEHSGQLTALYSGTLTRWHLSPGESVVAGQTIATLSSPELMVVQDAWLRASNALEQVRYEQDKDSELFREGIIAEQRLQQTRRRVQQAEFSLASYRQQLFRAGFSDTDLASLTNGKIQPGEYALKASGPGILSQRLFNAGQAIGANTPVATLQSDHALWLQAAIPSVLAASLEVGDQLQLAQSDTSVTLKFKNAAVTATTQMVDIMAAFDQPGDFLPGQTLLLNLPPLAQGVLIPASAVTHAGKTTTVYVRHSQGVEVRLVALLPMGNHYLATAGIAPGEELVTQGSTLIKGIQLGLGGGK
ncbi:efflux RND transporter periplasmic adaptor subunit [Porticoccus sp.]